MPMVAPMATSSKGNRRVRKADARPAKKAARTAARKAQRQTAPRGRKSTPALDVDADVLEFIAALDAYKNAHNRPFPSWSEVLHVLRSLGYRRK
jgi:hypothetical protein